MKITLIQERWQSKGIFGDRENRNVITTKELLSKILHGGGEWFKEGIRSRNGEGIKR